MSSVCCKDEIALLKENLMKWTNKLDELKQDYRKSLIDNLQKDLEIRELKKSIQKKKFIDFEHKLSQNCLNELNVIGTSLREDSKFIAVALYDLYDGNIDTIKQLTLSGRSKTGNKNEICSEKKQILESLFMVRLEHLPQQDVDDTRKKSLGRLLRNAIDNANKKS